MTERIVIDQNGFHVVEKERIVDAFYEKTEAETNLLFEQGVEEIRENGRAVFSRKWKDGITVDVTGGFDSRISLAAVLSSRNRDFVINTVVNNHSIGDVTVSELIADKFGLRRKNADDPAPISHLGNDAYRQHTNEVRSFVMGEQFQKIYDENCTSLTHELNTDFIRVAGGFGEIYKSYYVSRYIPDVASFNLSVSELASHFNDRLMSKFPYRSYNDDMKKRVESAIASELISIHGKYSQEKFNHLLTYYRLRSHFGCSYMMMLRYTAGFYWTPATSLSAFAYHNAMPYHKRYNKHPYIVNVDLAHAVYPEIADVPFTSGGVGNVKYFKINDSATDVTSQYSNLDISAWEKAWQEQITNKNNYNRSSVPPEVLESVREQVDLTNVLLETLKIFDGLAAYSDKMAEIFNHDLRKYIQERGVSNSINDFHMRVTMLTDMLTIFGGEVQQVSTAMSKDTVVRLSYVSKDILKGNQGVALNIDELISGKLTPIGNGYANFTSPDNCRTTWQTTNLCAEDKFKLFTLSWLYPFLEKYENTQERKYWKFCENVIDGYFGYLIWGGMTFFETRQKLPIKTEKAYAIRVIVMVYMLYLSPRHWYFAVHVNRMLRQHQEFLKKNENSEDEPIVALALLHLEALENNERKEPAEKKAEIKQLCEKIAVLEKEKLNLKALMKNERKELTEKIAVLQKENSQYRWKLRYITESWYGKFGTKIFRSLRRVKHFLSKRK